MSSSNYKVTGASALVKTPSGAFVTLYKDAQFAAADADAEHVKHLLDVGLVDKLDSKPADSKPADSKPADSK